jgi:transcriptional regulator with XRE-family HTH domain
VDVIYMAREAEHLDQLRRALGERLAVFRQDANLKQGELADIMYCDRTLITRIEAGTRSKDRRFWEQVDAVLHADGALLVAFDALDAAEYEYKEQRRQASLAAVRVEANRARRQATQLAQAVPYGPGVLHQAEQVRRGLDGVLHGATMSEAVLEDWERSAWRYGESTRDRPAGVLLMDLTVDLSDLKQAMARCQSASALRRLTRVAAQMAGLMVLTLVKLDDRPSFRRWARTARSAAREAGDPVTHAWVLAQEAYGHYYAEDTAQAIAVAQDAQAVAPREACVGAVLAAALEGRAQAVLGRHEETRRALGQAETLLSGLDGEVLLPSALGYNEAQLRFHESNALVHLGDMRGAWTAQDRALELVAPGDYMDKAFTQLDRAACLVKGGDVPAGASYLAKTLLGLTEAQRQGIISLRAQQIVETVPRQQVALPAIRDLQDLLPPSQTDKE